MAVETTTVTVQFTNVVVNVPLQANIQTSGDVSEIYMTYGGQNLPAVQGPDYSITIDPGLMLVTVTPLPPLMTKIAADGINVINVTRDLPLTSDFDYDSALVRERIVAEFDRLWMVQQQDQLKFGALPPVNSWNGRTGAVTMVWSDVQAVGGAPTASPAFTGTPTAPTAAPGDTSTKLATTKYVDDAVYHGITVNAVTSFNGRQGNVNLAWSDLSALGAAPTVSPVFTGDPKAPTPTIGDNDTSIATTAFVQNTLAAVSSGVVSWNARVGVVTMTSADITGAGGALASQLPVASAAIPLMASLTPTAGTATAWARGDHVHPTDTSLLPVGTMVPFAGPTAPAHWLYCFGQNVSRTTYAALFTALGTAHGVGDGSTTFGLPDMRGRTAAGKDNMGGTAAGILTTAGGGVDGLTLGAKGGGQNAVLGSANLPAHTHAISVTSGLQSADHTHAFNVNSAGESAAHNHQFGGNLARTNTGAVLQGGSSAGGFAGMDTESVGHVHNVAGGTGGMSVGHTHLVSGATDNGPGTGTALPIMQPTLVINWMIYTGV